MTGREVFGEEEVIVNGKVFSRENINKIKNKKLEKDETFDAKFEYLSIDLFPDHFRIVYFTNDDSFFKQKIFLYLKNESESTIVSKAIKYRKSFTEKKEKVNYKQIFKPFANLIRNKFNIFNIECTCYGFCYNWNRRKEDSIEISKIETFLKENNIKYKIEISDVISLRMFKISKSKSNLEKVKNYVA